MRGGSVEIQVHDSVSEPLARATGALADLEEEARTVREGTRALRIIFRKLAMIFVMASDATDFDYRACCRTICARCGREFGDHAWDPREPWVTILCDGRRVKL
jgi:hypothetical protein